MKNTYKIVSSTSKLCIFVAFSLLLIANCTLLSQITWQRIYRNPLSNDAWAQSICYGNNGNFFVIGGVAPTYPYLYALKINGYGDTLWSKVFGFGGRAYSCVASGDGGCVLTGDYGGAFSIKLDANGNILWQKFYNGGSCNDIKNTYDGGYIIASEQQVGFSHFGKLLRLSLLGDTLWTKYYTSANTTDFFAICMNNDTGFAVAGSKDSSSF